MIRNLLATTAIATLLSTGAYAQTAPAAPADPAAPGMATQSPMIIKAEGHLASNIIGERVYNSAGDDGERIGTVNDLILGADGSVEAIVVGVGGFLGIGQKNVALQYDLVKWEERDNDRYLVVETTREALEAQEEFDEAAFRPMPADAEVRDPRPATAEDLAAAPAADGDAVVVEQDTAAAPADGDATVVEQDTAAAPADGDATVVEQDTAAAPADGDATVVEQNTAAAPADGDATVVEQDTAAAPADGDATVVEQDTAAAPADGDAAVVEQDTAAATSDTDTMQTAAIDRSTLQDRALDQIRAEEFIGTTVYGANEENVGEVGDIVLSSEGQVDAIIVNVGGFLGMGEKEVALGMDNLQFMADEDGDLYLYTNLTKEQLEAQPDYDEAGYAENRDQMRMNVPAMQ